MIISRTPFRISFFGGGTDYPAWFLEHGGAVLATTINKYCYITCRYLPPFFEYKSRVAYSKVETVNANNEIKHPSVNGVLKYMNIGDGVEIHHDADIPARSGMGSSSSFTVGLLNALYALKGRMIGKMQLASEAIEIEQKVLKENVGCQDQVLTTYGGLCRVDFISNYKFRVTPIILSQNRSREFQGHLLLCFTGLSRIASEIAKEQIDNTRSKGKELSEIYKMVDDGMSILAEGRDINDFGKLLHESWMIKRSLTSKITTSKIDEIYDVAKNAGAIGGKLLGAGGGGFMLFFVEPEKRQFVEKALKGMLSVPFSFDDSGSQIISYQPPYEHDVKDENRLLGGDHESLSLERLEFV